MTHCKIKMLDPKAKLPTYATDGSAAFDLYAASARYIGWNLVEYGLGFSVEIPKDWGLFILSRSGQGFNMQQRLSNCVGLIDSDYRGEVKVQLFSDFVVKTDRSETYFSPVDLNPTKAIAQGVLLYVPQTTFEIVNELSDTARGTGGFGSTDKGTL